MHFGRLRTRLLRTSGFALIPMLGLVSPILALPAVTSAFGASGWTAVAIGQSIGGVAAVLIELGWALSGSQRVAPLGNGAARRVLALSLVTKFLVLLPVTVLALLIAGSLAKGHSTTAALTAAGTAMTGLSCVWFYIGQGKLTKVLLFDSIPRLGGVAAAALLIHTGGPIWSYPVIGIIVPCLVSLVLVIAFERLRFRLLHGFTLRRVIVVLKVQRNALAARSLSAIYISLPVSIVSVVSPDSVALFGAIERLQRMTLQVLAAVPNVMQNWIGKVTETTEKMRRIRHAIIGNAVFGLVAGTVYGYLAPTAADIIFSGVVTVTPTVSILSGILIFVVCLSRGTGNLALVALRKVHVITRSAAYGATVGLSALIIAAHAYGTVGALIAEIAAELVVLLVQVIGIIKSRGLMRLGNRKAFERTRL